MIPRIGVAAAGLVLSLAACEPDPRTATPPEEETIAAPEMPPPDPRRFIGRWAKSEEQCGTEWYRFYADELITATSVGLQCEILPPDGSFSDTEIRTLCKGGGRAARSTWTLAYEDDGMSMTITDEADETISLVKC